MNVMNNTIDTTIDTTIENKIKTISIKSDENIIRKMLLNGIHIEKIMELLIKYNKIEILLNISKYIDYSPAMPTYYTRSVHRIDYYIFIVLLSMLKIKYKNLYYLKDEIDYNEIIEACSVYKNIDYFIVVHKSKLNETPSLDFDHVSVYDRKHSTIYDIAMSSTQYIIYGSCTMNTLCYILDSNQLLISPMHIILIFKLMQKIPDVIIEKYDSIRKI